VPTIETLVLVLVVPMLPPAASSDKENGMIEIVYEVAMYPCSLRMSKSAIPPDSVVLADVF
jgi:hypothetical protein